MRKSLSTKSDQPELTSKRVLIADDDRALVEILTRRCEQIGLRVTQAFDARSALLSVLEDPPDLVCLDIEMPAGDGLSVCEVLSKDDSASQIPTIILTGRADPETRRRCEELHAYYLRKCPNMWCRVRPVIEELIDLSGIPAVQAECE